MINHKISVGVPAYNQGIYLKETIDSLLNQKTQPSEIVISDNHSTDETQDVLSRYGNEIKIIRPPRHLKAHDHWNFLTSNLKGEWFSLLSSDDIANYNYVSSILRGTQVSDNAVLVRGGYENITEKGKSIGKRHLLSVSKITCHPENVYEQLLGPKVNFAAFAVKKNAWEKVGGFPTTLNYYFDWAFWLLIGEYGDFVYVDEIISQYRLNYRPNLAKERLLDSLKDELVINNVIIPAALKNTPDVDFKKIHNSSRKRCLSTISNCSEYALNMEDRKTAVGILKKWAHVTNCSNELEKFEAGHKVRNNSSVVFFRKNARAIYQFIKNR